MSILLFELRTLASCIGVLFSTRKTREAVAKIT